MSNPKGARWEREVVTFLQEHGFPHAERAPRWGAVDKGDVTGMPGLVVECKAERGMDMAGAVDEAQDEADNADADFGIAVVKRRRKNVVEAYAVLPLGDMVDLLHQAGYGDSPSVAEMGGTFNGPDSVEWLRQQRGGDVA